MKFPLFLVIFVCFLFITRQRSRRAEEKNRQSIDDFWEREASANTTLPKDISNLPYVDFSGIVLPFACFPDDILAECEAQVKHLSEQKILNLTGISNTDLKLAYGPSNLTQLSSYDENFTLLVRTLNRWGHRLYELSFSTQAQTVLEFAVSIGSDIKATYSLLLTIYQETGNSEKISSLKLSASQLNSLMKQPILKLLSGNPAVD